MLAHSVLDGLLLLETGFELNHNFSQFFHVIFSLKLKRGDIAFAFLKIFFDIYEVGADSFHLLAEEFFALLWILGALLVLMFDFLELGDHFVVFLRRFFQSLSSPFTVLS